MLELIPLKLCPFCGADAHIRWVLADNDGKAIEVSCSRDGECPSPSWSESVNGFESDADCLESVSGFWNTRAEDWNNHEITELRVKLSRAESELRTVKFERDRAQKAFEQIAENYQTIAPKD